MAFSGIAGVALAAGTTLAIGVVVAGDISGVIPGAGESAVTGVAAAGDVLGGDDVGGPGCPKEVNTSVTE
jgi:hypothetical protein